MPKTVLITGLMLMLLLVLPAAGQQDVQAPAEASPTEADDEGVIADVDDAAEADELEDSDLDEQTYEEDDDDFIPTEEIPADEPVAFPSNI